MSSLKDARDLALINHSQGLITDEELLLLLEENKSRNPVVSYDVYDHFDLENMEEAKCKSEFRVEKHETLESPAAQWLEHPTRSRRVVGSNPIWDSDFFRVYFSPYI